MTDQERAAALAVKLATNGLAWTYEQIHPVDRADVLLIGAALRLLAEQAASHAPADLREIVAKALAIHDGCTTPDALYAPPQTMMSPKDPVPLWAEWSPRADAAISAISEAGYVIVPREPTQAMFLAAEKAGVSFQTQQRCWNAFVSAVAAKEGEP